MTIEKRLFCDGNGCEKIEYIDTDHVFDVDDMYGWSEDIINEFHYCESCTAKIDAEEQ